MPPKTVATPDEVAADLEEREVTVMPKLRRKNKHPGINKEIKLVAPTLTIKQIFP